MEKAQPLPNRKWTGLAKWVLIGLLVVFGIACFGPPLVDQVEMAVLLVCLCGIYEFKRWGFYGFLALRLAGIFMSLGAFGYVFGAEADDLAQGVFTVGWQLIVVSLIVRTRWTDMDPVKFPLGHEMKLFLGKTLAIITFGLYIVGGILSLFLTLKLVAYEWGLLGSMVAFVLAPVTFAVVPWYALAKYGALDLLIVNYGGGILLLIVRALAAKIEEGD